MTHQIFHLSWRNSSKLTHLLPNGTNQGSIVTWRTATQTHVFVVFCSISWQMQL